jgi:hypothetical protein
MTEPRAYRTATHTSRPIAGGERRIEEAIALRDRLSTPMWGRPAPVGRDMTRLSLRVRAAAIVSSVCLRTPADKRDAGASPRAIGSAPAHGRRTRGRRGRAAHGDRTRHESAPTAPVGAAIAAVRSAGVCNRKPTPDALRGRGPKRTPSGSARVALRALAVASPVALTSSADMVGGPVPAWTPW